MKLVCISDTHTKHAELIIPKGDILIHAGDCTFTGKAIEWQRFINFLKEQSAKFKHIIFIAGNHDFNTDLLDKKDLLDYNIHYLENSEIRINRLKFYGSPYTPIFYNWNFMKSEEDLSVEFNKISEDTDVLITHGPPQSILDLNADKITCGSKSLYERIKELHNLKAHIFGHIHESYGVETIDNIKFINASSLNRYYEYQNLPVVLEI